MDYLQIIVINWKWDRDEDYGEYRHVPTFFPQKEVGLECFQDFMYNSFQIKTDPVYDEKQQAHSPTTFVIPIRIDLRQLVGDATVHKKVNQLLFSELEKQIHQIPEFSEQKRQILYLIHKKYAFQDDLLKQLLNKQNCKYASFGNAIGALYDKRGLLDSSLGEYRVTRGLQAFVKNEEGLFRGVKKTNVDFVWADYWYKTRDRLEHMRAAVLQTLIPGYPAKEKEKIRALVQNFLYYVDKPLAQQTTENEQIVALENSIYGFEACEDLSTFSFSECLLEILKKYAEKEDLSQNEMDSLAIELNQLIDNIYQESLIQTI